MEIPDGDLEVHIQVGFSNKNADLDNVAKPFLDILQKRYRFNDSRVYVLNMYKKIVPKGEEYIAFSIFECLEGKDIV
jgi:Holliday junction resolvase RusA-like endonuclease